MPKTVRITWIDSTTLGILGTKVYRDDVEIADIANGVQTFDDINAGEGITYKYEVQAYTSTLESTEENIGVNVETIEVSGSIPTNYVFNGGSTSYLADEATVPTLLDGIVNQTWVIRVKRTANDVQHGLIGLANATNGLKLEVDAGDNQMDGDLRDTGQSSFINGAVSLDLAWHNYFFFFENLEIGVYEENTLITSRVDGDFTARTNGRSLSIGASVIGGVVGRLIGEVSDIQFYNKKLSVGEIADLNTSLSNTASGLIANFAGSKSTNEWTAEAPNNNFVLTNKGGVTTN